ncbi:hypothetical protein AWM79_13240 [Pseudomonas agarici]|uniref:Uncharacterized protein n=1 Tax=Pseudomonas agarici TaxID=46677 RepID=A0A0X1T2D2_PSEAA|nr:hypothetical protein [Pseudomonas agarici]AMB86212.1 hypothetical protein AWM79_13240 [Pseudomonas agarici]NWB90195.1 hypothetical protein [Pseudomonas agarici]NWC08874.1 hypothetical protein [Pseudomonas agarici]SEK60237.1 hypothetical protein SAMN05216604_104210 [Pseudomonas agarici]
MGPESVADVLFYLRKDRGEFEQRIIVMVMAHGRQKNAFLRFFLSRRAKGVCAHPRGGENWLAMLIDNPSITLSRLLSLGQAAARRHFVLSLIKGSFRRPL